MTSVLPIPTFVIPLFAQADVPEILTPEAIGPSEGHTVMQLVLGSGPVVQGVLILLVIMSVVTWGIVFTKSFQVKKAKRQTEKFSDVFWSSRNLAQISEISSKMSSSPVATVFSAGHRELNQILKPSTRK